MRYCHHRGGPGEILSSLVVHGGPGEILSSLVVRGGPGEVLSSLVVITCCPWWSR